MASDVGCTERKWLRFGWGEWTRRRSTQSRSTSRTGSAFVTWPASSIGAGGTTSSCEPTKAHAALPDAPDRHSTYAPVFASAGWPMGYPARCARSRRRATRQRFAATVPGAHGAGCRRSRGRHLACPRGGLGLLSGRSPVGYSTPSFTVVETTYWACPVLERHGFCYG